MTKEYFTVRGLAPPEKFLIFKGFSLQSKGIMGTVRPLVYHQPMRKPLNEMIMIFRKGSGDHVLPPPL